jgi:hypothetical protein
MLPILRTISVGGVLLAMTLFVLALSPPGDSRAHLARLDAPARGALIDRRAHPEWRQFLMLAAFRRAEELQELRALPDTPVRPAKAAGQVAALPDANADGMQKATGSAVTVPEATTIPVDIGEASSTELPVAPHEELPPVITVPQPRESGEPKPPPVAEKPKLRKAKRQENPDTPVVSKLKPLASRPKPHESRPRHTARIHHPRPAKRTKTSAQPAPARFELQKALFGATKPDAAKAPKTGTTAARN